MRTCFYNSHFFLKAEIVPTIKVYTIYAKGGINNIVVWLKNIATIPTNRKLTAVILKSAFIILYLFN